MPLSWWSQQCFRAVGGEELGSSPPTKTHRLDRRTLVPKQKESIFFHAKKNQQQGSLPVHETRIK
jgi:hypothetical protein